MILKLSTLLAFTTATVTAVNTPDRRHRLQTRLPKVRQTQVTSDLTDLLVSTSIGACGEPEPEEPYKVGDMMHVCVSTFDPATITAITSVTATPTGGDSTVLVDDVGDANLGTMVEGIETSEVTLSTLITVKYYYEAIEEDMEAQPVLTIDGTASVYSVLFDFEIDVPFEADSELAALGAGITTPAAVDICSCSPTSLEFTLDFSKTCDDNTLADNAGIDTTLCEPMGGEIETVTSIQFLEFDTSGNLIVINQDDSLFDVSFSDGDSFDFASISADLDASASLADQLDLVPGGVQLTLRGVASDGTDVMNRYTWIYTNSCDDVAIESGDEISWVSIVRSYLKSWVLSTLFMRKNVLLIDFYISIRILPLRHQHSALHQLVLSQPLKPQRQQRRLLQKL